MPKLEKILQTETSSIHVKREVTPYMDYPLHYHPEVHLYLLQTLTSDNPLLLHNPR